MSETLYKKIELPSEIPVTFVGVYVLKWGQVDEPTHGFIEVESDKEQEVKDD